MSTISWSYWAAGAGDAKASPAEACTMVVENARAVLCRREEKEEVLAECWASNVELVRSGALTTLRGAAAAALAKLRRAMALIAGVGSVKREERRRTERRDRLLCNNDFSMATRRVGRKKVGWQQSGFGCRRLSSTRTYAQLPWGIDGVWPRQGGH